MKKKFFVVIVALLIICPFTVNADEVDTYNVLNGLVTEGGYTYYYVNGVKQTGFQVIDGKTYFFSREGNNGMKVGITWIDDEYYDFGTDGIMKVNTWYENNGEKSYFGLDGKRVKGFQVIDGNTYFFSREGNNGMKVGITWIDDEYYDFGTDGIMKVNTWYENNGEKSYFGTDGRRVKGFQTIDGNTYFFSREGNNGMKVGITWIDDEYYNFGTDGIMKVNTWYESNGKKSYFGLDGKRVKGFQVIDGNTYFFSREGNNGMKVGITWIDDEYYDFGTDGIMKVNTWYENNGEKSYFGTDGRRVKAFQVIDGNTYFFSREGNNPMKVGITWIDDFYYYFDESGIMQTGWHKIKGDNRYFLSDGKMATSLTQIGQDFYGFDEHGNMLTKWQKINNKTYYFDVKTGIAKTGLQKIGRETYYFDISGIMLTGFQIIDGKTYFFSRDDGRLRTGFFWIDDHYYYFGESGVMQTGWVNMDEGIRYFDITTGKMQIGIVQIDNNKFYFNEDGIQEYGFIIYENNTYFFSRINNHEMRIGFIWIDDKYYYFNESGIMQTGFQFVDGITRFFSRDDGHMRTSWVLIDGYMYYFDPSTGEMAVGEKTIDNVNYVFNADGKLRDGFVTDTDGNIRYYYPDGTYANDWVTITGKKYFFNSLGIMIGENVKKVIDVSAYQGVIDWDTVISQGGVDGVILRIAAGCEEEDAMLARNIRELQRLGIPYGIYIYSYAENYNEGVLYANFTLEMIRKYNMNPTLGIFLDLESNGITSYMGTYEYEQVTRGFMNTMTNAGYGSISKIYTYKDYADTVLNSDYLRSLITWIAQYNHYCYYDGNYIGWQYSSSESIPGIEGNVDASVWF